MLDDSTPTQACWRAKLPRARPRPLYIQEKIGTKFTRGCGIGSPPLEGVAMFFFSPVRECSTPTTPWHLRYTVWHRTGALPKQSPIRSELACTPYLFGCYCGFLLFQTDEIHRSATLLCCLRGT